MPHMKYIILIALIIIGAFFLLATHSRNLPTGLGLNNGKLSSCPAKKNCVSSQDQTTSHYIAPLILHGEAEIVMARLVSTINSMPGATVVETNGLYLRAEFSSSFWRFVDDLECYHDPDNTLVHIRSASRTGYYDFDANRKRVELLRAMLSE